MNFDIKYATYLQIFDFIKIEQGLGTILGAQDCESKAKRDRQLWVYLGYIYRRPDMWGPQIRERNRFFAGLKLKK